MNTMDQELPKNVNPYFSINFIKSSSNSLSLDKKVTPSYKASDKELAYGIQSRDPSIQHSAPK